MLTALSSLICAFAYRLRGGGFFQFGHNWIVRLIWGGAIVAAYVLIALGAVMFLMIPALVGLAYVTMLVPHAYAQNIGRWPTPQKQWPSFWLPAIGPATWTAWPQWKRAGYDTLSMFSIGTIRGAILFSPFAYFMPFHFVLSCLTIGVLQAASYFTGYYVPLKITNSIPARSVEWGEVLNGAAWAVALTVLLA